MLHTLPMILELTVLFALILFNGIFAMSELAIVSAKKVVLRQLAEQGNKNAERALMFADDTGRFLPTVQVGITLIGVLAGAFSGATLADHVTDYLILEGINAERAELISVSCMVIAVTYITLIIGELVPKELALRNPERLALFVTPIIYVLSMAAWPVVWFLNRSSKLVLWIIRAKQKPESTVTEAEVKALIAEGTDYGIFAEREQDMLTGVMLLADKPVRAFMMPRIDVVAFSSDAGPKKVQKILTQHGYSRFPVIDADDEHHVLGIVHLKDLLTALLSEDQPFDLKPMIQDVAVFPDTTSALKVIEHLRKLPLHIAVIVDEHGSFEGIVTLMDLVAVIMGDVHEHGETGAEIKQRKDGSWLMDGSVIVDKAFQEINLQPRPESKDYHTIAGFFLHRFHSLPKAGDFIEYGDFRFEVMDMDGRRIDKLLVTKMIKPEEGSFVANDI